MKVHISNTKGFTILEIVAVLLVIGIITAVAISRVTSQTVYSLDTEHQIIKSHLRYAQVRALSDDTSWGITFSSSSYRLQNNGVNTATYLPAESSSVHNLPAGMTISPATTVTFDHLGSPGSAAVTLTLTNSGQTRSIVITKNTGYIP